jgi:hypothetical protein
MSALLSGFDNLDDNTFDVVIFYNHYSPLLFSSLDIRPILSCTLEPDGAWLQSSRLIPSILQEKSHDTMRRDVLDRHTADGGAVVGVRPKIL